MGKKAKITDYDEITLNLKDSLRDWQKEFFENYKKYNVLVIHRRGGKTVVAILFLIYRALSEIGTYGYIAPFRTQAKSIAWDILVKFVTQIPGVETNISELFVKFPNGSKINLFGADNQDALRGLDLKGVVLDEYAQMSPNIYDEILFPMLNAHEDSFTVWIGTPKGKNQFYDLYTKAKSDYYRYYTMYMDITKTKLLSIKQVNEAKRTMDEDSFKQEYLLDWDVAIKGSYYGKEINRLREDGRVITNLYNENYGVYTAWDIGLDDSTVILCFQYIDGTIRVIDLIEGQGNAFNYYNSLLKQKPYKYIMHFFPHDIMVKEFSSGLTRFETVQRLFGYDKTQVLKRHSVEDGINMVRELLYKCLFDYSLEEYLNILGEYRPKRNEKTGEFGKPIHCDYSDAMRYLCQSYTYYVENIQDYDTFSVNFNHLL